MKYGTLFIFLVIAATLVIVIIAVSMYNSSISSVDSLSTYGVNPLSYSNYTVRVTEGLTYCTVNGTTYEMDIWEPVTNNSIINNAIEDQNITFPAIVYVHGGGWISGDKSTAYLLWETSLLVKNGFVVASIDYGLAPGTNYVGQEQDVKCAVRSLRANSAQWHINPNEIGAWGDSAGGNLVSLLAVTNKNTTDSFIAGQYQNESSSVSAVFDLCGPENITAEKEEVPYIDYRINDAFNGTNAEILGSPDTYLVRNDVNTSGDPPILIFQGVNDTLVPESQSIDFYNDLQAAGVPSQLVLVKNAGHEVVPINKSVQIVPSQESLGNTLVAFFNTYLKHG